MSHCVHSLVLLLIGCASFAICKVIHNQPSPIEVTSNKSNEEFVVQSGIPISAPTIATTTTETTIFDLQSRRRSLTFDDSSGFTQNDVITSPPITREEKTVNNPVTRDDFDTKPTLLDYHGLIQNVVVDSPPLLSTTTTISTSNEQLLTLADIPTESTRSNNNETKPTSLLVPLSSQKILDDLGPNFTPNIVSNPDDKMVNHRPFFQNGDKHLLSIEQPSSPTTTIDTTMLNNKPKPSVTKEEGTFAENHIITHYGYEQNGVHTLSKSTTSTDSSILSNEPDPVVDYTLNHHGVGKYPLPTVPADQVVPNEPGSGPQKEPDASTELKLFEKSRALPADDPDSTSETEGTDGDDYAMEGRRKKIKKIKQIFKKKKKKKKKLLKKFMGVGLFLLLAKCMVILKVLTTKAVVGSAVALKLSIITLLSKFLSQAVHTPDTKIIVQKDNSEYEDRISKVEHDRWKEEDKSDSYVKRPVPTRGLKLAQLKEAHKVTVPPKSHGYSVGEMDQMFRDWNRKKFGTKEIDVLPTSEGVTAEGEKLLRIYGGYKWSGGSPKKSKKKAPVPTKTTNKYVGEIPGGHDWDSYIAWNEERNKGTEYFERVDEGEKVFVPEYETLVGENGEERYKADYTATRVANIDLTKKDISSGMLQLDLVAPTEEYLGWGMSSGAGWSTVEANLPRQEFDSAGGGGWETYGPAQLVALPGSGGRRKDYDSYSDLRVGEVEMHKDDSADLSMGLQTWSGVVDDYGNVKETMKSESKNPSAIIREEMDYGLSPPSWKYQENIFNARNKSIESVGDSFNAYNVTLDSGDVTNSKTQYSEMEITKWKDEILVNSVNKNPNPDKLKEIASEVLTDDTSDDDENERGPHIGGRSTVVFKNWQEYKNFVGTNNNTGNVNGTSNTISVNTQDNKYKNHRIP